MVNENAEAVYAFICDFIQSHGYPPNSAEIAEGCCLLEEAVAEQLRSLQATGKIVRQIGKPRSIRLMSELIAQLKRENPIPLSTTEVIYAFIREYIQKHTYAPTIREIMVGANVSSTSLVLHHIEKLKAAGRIKSRPNSARTLTLCSEEAADSVAG